MSDYINLKKLKLESLDPTRLCMMFGRRGSGKSKVVKAVLSALGKRFRSGIVFSKMEHINNEFKSMIPDSFIHRKIDFDMIENFLKHCEKKKSMWLEAGADPETEPFYFMLFDDQMEDKKVFKDPIMRNLFLNGRHANLFIIVTCQQFMDLDITMRDSVDYCFFMRTTKQKEIQKIHEHFCGHFASPKQFHKVFMEATADYRCLVLNNITQSSNIEDVYSYYRADINAVPPKICQRHVWRFHDRHYKTAKRRRIEEDNNEKKYKRICLL